MTAELSRRWERLEKGQVELLSDRRRRLRRRAVFIRRAINFSLFAVVGSAVTFLAVMR